MADDPAISTILSLRLTATDCDGTGLEASRLSGRQKDGLAEPRKLSGLMFLPLHISAIARRDKACSFADFSTKGGNCTAHGGRFFYHTKPLQTLIETGVWGLFVKYVFLTSAQKAGKVSPGQRRP
jgi:hypothetical protein